MTSPQSRIPLLHVAVGLLIAGGGPLLVEHAGGTSGIAVMVACVVFGAIAAIVPGMHFRHRVQAPLNALRDVISLTRNDGDLTRRLDQPPDSVIAPSTEAYNGLVATLRGIITRILFASNQVARVADRLVLAARETAQGSDRQIATAREAADGVAEVVAGVDHAATRAEEAARIARAAREDSARGAEIVLEASAEIELIARTVEESAQVVAALGERSSEISGIVKTIHSIADQTNLLALNAAIEAARAGEQGRGFAVVADEVRKLAERTTAATGEISALIAAIQIETDSAIATIKAGSLQASNGAQLAGKAAAALEAINRGAQETLDNVSMIAATMSQQNSRARTIAAQVTDIIGLAESNSRNAGMTLSESTQLTYLATNLQDVGSIFKLGVEGDAAMRLHERMPALVQGLARSIGAAFEQAIDQRQLALEDLFDTSYLPIIMSELLKSVDARTRLAGTNKLEILLFSLGTDARTGRRETFGINVFKVREVMNTPTITAAPEMNAAVKGMVSLRGALVPVVDLGDYVASATDSQRKIMIVTEYNHHTQGFLVEAVDTILRVDWAQMRVPPEMLSNNLGGLVTAVTELEDGRLVMLLDVERILAETVKAGRQHAVLQHRAARSPGPDGAVRRRLLGGARTDPAHPGGHGRALGGRGQWPCRLGRTAPHRRPCRA
jgi:methyl-accepting chemotaxis protein